MSHPVDAILESIPYDRPTVLREAIRYARRERQMQVRLFGRGAASLYECAKFGMDAAIARDDARRARVANDIWQRSLDPLTRERRAIELEIWRLNDKLLGENWPDARRFMREKIADYRARLAEIAAMTNREAA